MALCPSDPAPILNQGAGGSTYSGINYMVSFGSGTKTNYDLRWRTDGFVYENSGVRFGDVTDGTSNTVMMSETVRSVGPDFMLTAGVLPKAPYQATLNGSSGASSSLQAGAGNDRFRQRIFEWPEWLYRKPESRRGLAEHDQLARRCECRTAWSRHFLGSFGRHEHAHQRLHNAEQRDS